MKLAPDEDFRIAAETLKQSYDEFIKVGFTKAQAMRFCEIIMTGGAIQK
jgi:hypothetical protein